MTSKSFKEGGTGVENIRRLHYLQEKLRPTFWGLCRCLIHRQS